MQNIKKLHRLFEEGAVFTAFDTETTGLYPVNDRVIEIGAVRFSKDGVQDQYSQLINPEMPMPYMAMKVNGITDTMLYKQPLFRDIYPQFKNFIQDSILIAHNTRFDISFINTELEKAQLPELKAPHVPAYDTVRLAQKCYPHLRKFNLQYLASVLIIPVYSAHRALDDARVCMEIFLKCMEVMQKDKSIGSENRSINL